MPVIKRNKILVSSVISLFLFTESQTCYGMDWLSIIDASNSDILTSNHFFQIDMKLLNQSWQQTDKPQISTINQAIEHNYQIDNANVYQLDIHAYFSTGVDSNIRIPVKFTFSNLPETNGESQLKATSEKLSFLTGLVFRDSLGVLFEVQNIETSGSSFGFDPETDREGNIKFTTEISNNSLRLMSYHNSWLKGFNLGYRITNKTIPQSLYVMSDNSTLSPLATGYWGMKIICLQRISGYGLKLLWEQLTLVVIPFLSLPNLLEMAMQNTVIYNSNITIILLLLAVITHWDIM